MILDIWDIGNYPWSVAFIWIAAVAGLLVGFLLFASYMTSRKKYHLIWAIALLGLWAFCYEMIDFYTSSTNRSTGQTILSSGPGTYAMLVGGFDTSLFGIFVALGLLWVPGMIAAGFCYHKNEKLGMFYTLGLVFITVIYLLCLIEPNTGQLPDGLTAKIAAVLILVVQLPSAAIIIALPLMDLEEGPMWPKIMVSVSGGIMLTINILLWLVTLMASLGKPLSDVDGGTTDIFLMIYPFFLVFWVIILIFGLIGNKGYEFALPHVEFEEAVTEPAAPTL